MPVTTAASFDIGLTLNLWIDAAGLEVMEDVPKPTYPAQMRVECQPGASIGQLSHELRRQLSLVADQVEIRTVDGLRLPEDALVSTCQIVQHQRLQLTQHGPAEVVPFEPVLAGSDAIRVVHLSGPSLGLAYSFRPGLSYRLGFSSSGSLAIFAAGQDNDSLIEPVLSLTVDEWLGSPVLLANPLKTTAAVEVNGLQVSAADTRIELGSLLVIRVSSQGEVQTLRLRVMRASDHDATRNRHGFVPLTVVSVDEGDQLDDEFKLQLESKPTGDEPKLDLIEIGLQDGSMLVMALGLMFAFGGFQLWRLLYLALPVGRIIYRFYQHDKKTKAWDSEIARWKDETLAELGALHERAVRESTLVVARNPSLDSIPTAFFGRTPELWSRRLTSTNFGRVSIGRGIYTSKASATFPGRLTSGDREALQTHADRLRLVPNVPLEHDFRQEHLALNCDDPDQLAAVTASILTRLLFTHSPLNLKLAVLLPDIESLAAEYGWLRAMPHVHSHSTLAPQDRVRFGRTASDDLLERLLARPADDRESELVLLVVHDGCHANASLLAAVLATHPARVRLMWLASGSLVPSIVRAKVEFGYSAQPRYIRDQLQQDVALEVMTNSVRRDIARCAGPLIDDTGQAVSAGIPREVPLSRLVSNIEKLSAVEELWATLGETATGAFRLDLVDAGPHLLIGGTTGSGKSELIRTLVLSLAASYDPDELRVLLIDYKGGASLKTLRGLAHQVGFVSNLGEDDVERCIEFLTAELERRQDLLADYEGDYKNYRTRTGKLLPRLVVVIDEFGGFSAGTNKTRQKAILDIAARGRSQGVHLILATQSPKTVVSEEVRANVNARLCLRTLDARESAAVLNEDIAWFIPRDLKGRTYARLDTGELVQFQSGHSQSRSIYGRQVESVAASKVRFDGSLVRHGSLGGVERVDDIVLLERLASAYGVGPRLPDPEEPDWKRQPVLLPALMELPQERLLVPIEQRSGKFEFASLGVCDDPRQLEQRDLSVDLAAGALLVTGGSRSGRTHLLAVAAASAAQSESPPVLVAIDGGATGELGGLLRGMLGSDWGWDISDDIGPTLERLISQIQIRNPRASHVLILIDRLDLALASSVTAQLTLELSQLVASGAKRGIRIIATTDDRTSLNDELARAFRHRFRLRSDGTRILRDDKDLLSRVFAIPKGLSITWTPVPNGDGLGILSDAQVQASMATHPRPASDGLRFFFDDVAQLPIDFDPSRSLAIAGSRPADTASALDAAGRELYRMTRVVTPCIFARGHPSQVPVHWHSLNPELEAAAAASKASSGGNAVEVNAFTNIIEARCASVGRVAIFDLDYLEYFAERQGFVPTSLLDALSRTLTKLDSQIIASGPISILVGKAAQTNRISDRLRRTEGNFIMLAPPDEDTISGELGLFRGTVHTALAGRPGRSYPPGYGYAYIDGIRHEGHIVERSSSQLT